MFPSPSATAIPRDAGFLDRPLPPIPSPGSARPAVVQSLVRVENRSHLHAAMYARWGNVIEVRASRPDATHTRPAIWCSASNPGEFGCFVPGHGAFLEPTLAAAHESFGNAGYETPRAGDEALHETPRSSEPARHVATRISNGAHVEAHGELDVQARRELERGYGITVTPLLLGGKEIACLLSKSPCPKRVLLCARSGQADGIFLKPPGVQIEFADRGKATRTNPLEFAASLQAGQEGFAAEDIVGYGVEAVPNTRLAPRAVDYADAAALVGREAGVPPLGLALLSPYAHHVKLADLIQSLTDTLEQEPNSLVCHFADKTRAARGEYEPLLPAGACVDGGLYQPLAAPRASSEAGPHRGAR